jgi:hypothetical protein
MRWDRPADDPSFHPMVERRLHAWAEQLTDDELLAEGARLERELSKVGTELDEAIRAIVEEQRAIRKATVKLGINTAIAAGGIIAAPVTLGISLVLTIGGFTMILWDGVDHVRDRTRHHANRMRLRHLRTTAEAIEDDLAAIVAALEHRVGH